MSSPATQPPSTQGSPPRHAPGETSGSPQRPPQHLTGSVLVFDLQRELDRLRQEPAWQRGGRNAITLVKESAMRVVLTVMRSGSRLREHAVDGQFTVQTVAGRLRLHLPDGPIELGVGQLASVESGLARDVEALEETAFLLTIGLAPSAAG